MAGEKIFRMWLDVPNRSKLVVSAQTGDSSTFVVATLDGIATSTTGKVEGKIKGVLNTATGDEESIALRTPKTFVIDVILTYITDASVTVRASIDPERDDVDDKFVTKLTRKKGAVEAVTLFVATA